MKIKQSRLKSSLMLLLILVLLLGFYQLWPYLVFEKIQTDSVQQIFLYNHQIPLQDSWNTLIEVKDCADRAFLLEQAGQIQLVKRAHDRDIPFGFFPRIHLQSKTWHQTITFFSEPEGPMIMVYTEKYNSSGQSGSTLRSTMENYRLKAPRLSSTSFRLIRWTTLSLHKKNQHFLRLIKRVRENAAFLVIR